MSSIVYLRGHQYHQPDKTFEPLQTSEIVLNGLADLSRVSSEGIPHFWGPAFYFSWMLTASKVGADGVAQQQVFCDQVDHAQEILVMYLKGIFCGLITMKEMDLREGPGLTPLKRIARESPWGTVEKIQYFIVDSNRLDMANGPNRLECGTEIVVAVQYPESLLFPAASFSSWPSKPAVNTAEAKLFGLIDDYYSGPEGADLERLFGTYLVWLLSKNKHARSMSTPWYWAVAGYIREKKLNPPQPDSAFLGLTRDQGRITLLSGVDDLGRAEFQEAEIKVRAPVNLSVAQYINGFLVVDGRSYDLAEFGIAFNEATNNAVIFEPLARPKLLFNRFNWTLLKDRIVLSYMGQTCPIYGEILEPKDIFVDQILILEDDQPESEERFKGPAFPDKPVKERYLSMVRSCHAVPQGAGSVLYRMDIAGLGQTDKEYSCANSRILVRKISEFSPNLAFWPNFRCPTWTVHYAHYSSHGRAAGQFFFKVKCDGKDFRELRDRQTIRSESSFGEVILLGVDDRGGTNEYGVYDAGSCYVELAPDREGIVNVGIDFGTSNTCVAWRRPNETSETSLAISGNNIFFFHVPKDYRPHLFFPAPERPKVIIPSEIFVKERHADLTPDDWLDGPLKYAIPILDHSFADDGSIKRNMKWSDDPRYLKAYFHELFLMVFAEIERLKYRNVNLGFSYPCSFTKGKYTQYFTAILDVLEKVQDETGITVNGLGDISEAEAGANIAKTISRKKVIVDMGGGTTDIAVLDEKNNIVFSDSVNFAGNHLADIILKKARRTGEQDRWEYEQNLRRGIGLKDISSAEVDIAEHFEIIADVVRRFLCARDHPECSFQGRLNTQDGLLFYPLGQAWQYFNAGINLVRDDVLGRYFSNYRAQEIAEPKTILAKSVARDCGEPLMFEAYRRKIKDGVVARRTIIGANVKAHNLTSSKDLGALPWGGPVDWIFKADDFDIGQHLYMEFETGPNWRKEFLLEDPENKLGLILQRMMDSKVVSIENFNADLDKLINDRQLGHIGLSQDGRPALKVSPFVLFIERLKEYRLRSIG